MFSKHHPLPPWTHFRGVNQLVAVRGETNCSNNVRTKIIHQRQKPNREKCLTVIKIPKHGMPIARLPNDATLL